MHRPEEAQQERPRDHEHVVAGPVDRSAACTRWPRSRAGSGAAGVGQHEDRHRHQDGDLAEGEGEAEAGADAFGVEPGLARGGLLGSGLRMVISGPFVVGVGLARTVGRPACPDIDPQDGFRAQPGARRGQPLG